MDPSRIPNETKYTSKYPAITGDAKGKPGEEYHYTISTTDIDSDDVYYYVNWSDNTPISSLDHMIPENK